MHKEKRTHNQYTEDTVLCVLSVCMNIHLHDVTDPLIIRTALQYFMHSTRNTSVYRFNSRQLICNAFIYVIRQQNTCTRHEITRDVSVDVTPGTVHYIQFCKCCVFCFDTFSALSFVIANDWPITDCWQHSVLQLGSDWCKKRVRTSTYICWSLFIAV